MRDLTKYRFDGEIFGKGRLVQALVQRYVIDHPGIRFTDLVQAFPDWLQADSHTQFNKERAVVVRLESLPEKSHRYFFTEEPDLIRLDDAIVVVSAQWNPVNIGHMLTRAAELGYSVEPL